MPHSGDNIVNIHAFDQGTDSLQVAVAAAEELDVADLIVLNLEANHLGTGSLGSVSVLHNICSFLS